MESMEQVHMASNEQAEVVQQFSEAIEKLTIVSGQMEHFVKEVLR